MKLSITLGANLDDRFAVTFSAQFFTILGIKVKESVQSIEIILPRIGVYYFSCAADKSC
jgi:hypothetical protein